MSKIKSHRDHVGRATHGCLQPGGLILQWSGQKCNHVRDKVLALLDLIFHPFQWKKESVSVDYNKTIEEVYRDVLSTPRFTRFGRDATEHFCVILMGILGVKEFYEIARNAYEEAMLWVEDEKM
jgi:hypothetical protein